MSTDICVRRLTKELRSIKKDPIRNPNIAVNVDDANILEVHYVSAFLFLKIVSLLFRFWWEGMQGKSPFVAAVKTTSMKMNTDRPSCWLSAMTGIFLFFFEHEAPFPFSHPVSAVATFHHKPFSFCLCIARRPTERRRSSKGRRGRPTRAGSTTAALSSRRSIRSNLPA